VCILDDVARLWRRGWDGSWLGRADVKTAGGFFAIKGVVGVGRAWTRRRVRRVRGYRERGRDGGKRCPMRHGVFRCRTRVVVGVVETWLDVVDRWTR
jgi:hypothetical protein